VAFSVRLVTHPLTSWTRQLQCYLSGLIARDPIKWGIYNGSWTCVDTVLKFGLDLTQFLENRFVRWELFTTSKHIFNPYLIRCITLNQNFEQHVVKILIWGCLIGQIIQFDVCRLANFYVWCKELEYSYY